MFAQQGTVHGLIYISHPSLLAISEPAVLSPKDAVYQGFSLKCILEISRFAWESQKIQTKSRVIDFEGFFQERGFYLLHILLVSLTRKSIRCRFSISRAGFLWCLGFFLHEEHLSEVCWITTDFFKIDVSVSTFLWAELKRLCLHVAGTSWRENIRYISLRFKK